MLTAHNQARAQVGSPPLAWSKSLAFAAQQWAATLVNRGTYGPRPDTDLGQNIYEITGGEASADAVVSAWLSEKSNYNPRSNTCAGRCGHYTQVLWRNTMQVGCGVAGDHRRQIWVCFYAPHGNVAGERPF